MTVVVRFAFVDRASVPIQTAWWRMLWFQVRHHRYPWPIAQRLLDEANRNGGHLDRLPAELIPDRKET